MPAHSECATFLFIVVIHGAQDGNAFASLSFQCVLFLDRKTISLQQCLEGGYPEKTLDIIECGV